MKLMGTVEYLCKSHPYKPSPDCLGCRTLQKLGRQAQQLRAERLRWLEELKQAIQAGAIVIGDIQ